MRIMIASYLAALFVGIMGNVDHAAVFAFFTGAVPWMITTINNIKL